VRRTLSELVEANPREKTFADEEETENDAELKLCCTQPEADMLALVFANIIR